MRLSKLLQSIESETIYGSGDPEITGIHYDSRTVKPGGLFFALKGASVDGHAFIPAAVDNGAAAVIAEHVPEGFGGCPLIKAADTRLAMARAAAAFYGDATANFPLIGITGTNGKTTTTYLIEGIMNAAGLPAAVLGTISYRFGGLQLESTHTTPESTDLQAALQQLAGAGARSFVMEVSSHSLEQKRVDGCHFDVGIFTNLTRDHLDYHGSMERYFSSKTRLFAELLRPDALKPLRRAAVNMDDPSAAAVRSVAVCPVLTYGTASSNDIYGVDIGISVDGIAGEIQTPVGRFGFSSHLLGRFNLSNILAAVSAGVALDLPLAAIKSGIEAHLPVPGRMERVANDRGVTCLVDYAHTGDALENVLSTIKEIASGRIITVFGCGGDRDNGKRPIMGAIAAHWSDLAIVTSDNPRTEDPQEILRQVKGGISPLGIREYRPDELAAGFREKGFTVCENRRQAIHCAVRLAQHGDILLIAGKGHEDYQIIGRTKHHFDDREEAAEAFRSC
jgi:UDP-N-acetylmuramoyl-L-alanyl-D-glutamate--2,6-diaminopimelate ligase